MPYAKDAEDDDAERGKRREREYVASAAYEQAMGRGGVPDQEVPVPLDDGALDSPDAVTKAEWDALWPSEDLIKPMTTSTVSGSHLMNTLSLSRTGRIISTS